MAPLVLAPLTCLVMHFPAATGPGPAAAAKTRFIVSSQAIRRAREARDGDLQALDDTRGAWDQVAEAYARISLDRDEARLRHLCHEHARQVEPATPIPDHQGA